MIIFYLIPIALLALPFVAFVMVIGHSSRIKVLEDSVAELKKSISPVVSNKVEITPQMVQSPVQPSVPTQSPIVQSITLSPSVSQPSSDPVSSEDTSGKILGRIGIAAVLIGVAFFLKYAFDNNWIGPAGRVMIGIIAGLGFLGLGQYLRAKYLQYSDLIMGGGIAISYLSIFSAHTFYNLIDSPTTGVLMFLVTLLSFAISIVNATQILAVVSVIGAFATPFLVGSQENSMVVLFGYIILINIGVLGISFFKKWPPLNLASFIGTIINFVVWYTTFYTTDALAPVLIFCVITFVIFLVAQVARVITASVKADESDYLLLGSNALAFAIIIYNLLNPDYHGILGFVSVLIAIVYMAVAFMVNKANPEDKAINIFLPGLAVVFLSIAVPLQFSGAWIAVAWFIEACFLYGIAFVIGNRGFQVMGLVVYILGLVDFIVWYLQQSVDQAFVPLFNTPFVMFLLATITAYIIAYIYKKYGSVDTEVQKRGILAFVIIANVLSIWGLSAQITSYYSAQVLINAQDYSNISNTLVSILWTLYAAILTAVGFTHRAVSLRRFGLILFLITAFKVLIDVWSMGELYRIISFICFGIIALVASFGYVKYKDRLKNILSLVLLVSAGSVLASGLFGGTPEAHAAFTLKDWQYVRSIDTNISHGEQTKSGYVKAILPVDISWVSKTGSFTDARIIDGQGNEVPYLLVRDQLSSSPSISARLIDFNSSNTGSSQFIADIGRSDGVYSTLNLDIDGSVQNFRRQVSVYSSDSLLPIDDPRWSLVTSKGFIFRILDPSSGQVSGKYSISLGAHSARYLKVVIGSGPEGSVGVSGVTVQSDVKVLVGSNDSTFSAVVNDNPKDKTTDVTIDLGIIGRLSDSVTLNISSKDTNYIRNVAVSASDDMGSWSYVGGGSISRVSTSIFNGSSNVVTYPETRARYLRLSIANNDNPPLSVVNSANVSTSLEAIIFNANFGDSYKFYYGNPTATQPEYDTSQLSSYIDQGSLPVVNVGEQVSNSSYVAPLAPVVPFTERNKNLLNTLLIILVVIIGGGVWWYLKSYIKK